MTVLFVDLTKSEMPLGLTMLGLPGAPDPQFKFFSTGGVSPIPASFYESMGSPAQVPLNDLSQYSIEAMNVPASGFPASGYINFPDGTRTAVNAGVACIPTNWVSWATSVGFTAYTGN